MDNYMAWFWCVETRISIWDRGECIGACIMVWHTLWDGIKHCDMFMVWNALRHALYIMVWSIMVWNHLGYDVHCIVACMVLWHGMYWEYALWYAWYYGMGCIGDMHCGMHGIMAWDVLRSALWYAWYCDMECIRGIKCIMIWHRHNMHYICHVEALYGWVRHVEAVHMPCGGIIGIWVRHVEAVHTPCGGGIWKWERAIGNVCVHHYIHVCMSVDVDAYRYICL